MRFFFVCKTHRERQKTIFPDLWSPAGSRFGSQNRVFRVYFSESFCECVFEAILVGFLVFLEGQKPYETMRIVYGSHIGPIGAEVAAGLVFESILGGFLEWFLNIFGDFLVFVFDAVFRTL